MKKIIIKDKKSFIIGTVVATVAIGCGVGVGLYLGQEFITPQTDYSSLNAEELEDDNKSLFNSYLKTNNNDYIKSFEPYQLANIGLYKMSQCDFIRSTDIGEVNASGIVQTIYGTSIKENGKYFNESISDSSLVHVARRFYQTNDSVDVYSGSVTSFNTASWSKDAKETLTANEFESLWGKTLERRSIYVVSSKTVLESSVEEQDSTYIVNVKLDPTLSVIRYVKQMKMMSDLSRYPEFSKVEITFTLDKDLTLLTSTVNEDYKVWKFGPHDSSSTLTSTYFYSNDSDIPDLNTNCKY